VGAALDELLQHAHIPEALLLYATRYCSQYRLPDDSKSQTCSSSEGLQSDKMVMLQVALAVLYATSAGMAILATATRLKFCHRLLPQSKLWTSVGLCIALVTAFVASLVVTVIVCAVHMVVVKSLPSSAIQLEIGDRYLISTWAAFAGMLVAFGAWVW
jgi:hypothetical protein